HAWVEYRTTDEGGWQVTDASLELPAPPAVASRGGLAGLRDPDERDDLRTGLREQYNSYLPPAPAGFHVTVPAWRVPKEALGLLGAAPLLALAFAIWRPRVKREVQLDEE